MKALRLHSAGKFQFHDEPLPIAKTGEALVQVGAVGLCGSDLHWFGGGGIGDARLERPLVLGHELAGWKEDGQLVAIDPSIPCGECRYCREDNPNLCPQQRFAGHAGEDGGLREYMAWPENCLVPLPDGFTPVEGVMLEPLGVALYSVELSSIQPGDMVGVFGCGPIGLLIIRLAKLAGAGQVIATDILPHRVEAAKACGADQAYFVGDGRGVELVSMTTQGYGLDVAVEAAGDNEAVEAALELVRPGGRVTLVGIPSNDRTSVCASTARRKGLSLQWVRRMKHTYPKAIELVKKGQVNVNSLVSHSYPFEKANIAFQTAYKREGLKVIINIEPGKKEN
ncbi:MAG: alcohol dehydrogenase catalytic domain-containing protein [Anaerolineales bacterium]|nr:alcohol dehydrogenase catalytic domain-containing protein [Anaerolineales bacterium]